MTSDNLEQFIEKYFDDNTYWINELVVGVMFLGANIDKAYWQPLVGFFGTYMGAFLDQLQNDMRENVVRHGDFGDEYDEEYEENATAWIEEYVKDEIFG